MSSKESAEKVISIIPCTLDEGDEFSIRHDHSILEEFFILELLSRFGDHQVLTDRAGLQRLADDLNAFLAGSDGE